MVSQATLIERDLKHVWHPCTQMKDFETCPPIEITHAKKEWLYTPNGKLIDAISSWWCKPLGHQHPAIISAIQAQLHKFEHTIAAHTTSAQMVELTERLAKLSGLPYSLFASDGSCAVEMGLKLAIHARQIQGLSHKTKFIALKQGYHGETLGALSVSDMGIYKAPYAKHCFQTHTIPIPYVPKIDDAAPNAFDTIKPQLEAIKDECTALIFEPLVQGAGGMQVYSLDFLNQLIDWAKRNQILCIADEIMTGFCRTGKGFAFQYTAHTPDIICVSKGLTGGALPLSMTLISQALFDCFYHDYHPNYNFLHSHTHSGNALAVSAAVATLKVMEEEGLNEKAQALELQMRQAFSELQTQTGKLKNLRGLGGIMAADIISSKHQRAGFKLYQEALKRGALIRPIGQHLYWFPPLNIHPETLEKLTQITYESINAIDAD